jgi:hypothetical protein
MRQKEKGEMEKTSVSVVTIILCTTLLTMLLAVPLCTRQAQASPTTVVVTTNPLWTDTGLSIANGDTLDIKASGIWAAWISYGWLGPDGVEVAPDGAPFDRFYSGANWSELIAFVGPNPYQGHWGDSSFFPQPHGYWAIGSSRQFTSNETGELWLGLNDDAVSEGTGDNAGSVTASVTPAYYLTVQTSPPGVNSPTGAGWYDDGTYASISTPQDVDIVSGSSRYDFRGWHTGDISEITDPSALSTTVFMDKNKTVTADYVIQYYLTVQTSPLGVNSPTGAGWHDSGTSASISTPRYVVKVPGVSRFSFAGWTTINMSEIANPSSLSTTVLMDKAKTVTADYVVQYNPTASFTWSPPMPRATKTVTFDASASTANTGTIVSYTWDFGDGNTTTFMYPTITHRYAVSKRYNVTLTVLNSVNLTGSVTEHVKITHVTDIDMNGVVDVSDLTPVVAAFGSYPGNSRWDPACDMNADNIIDVYDVSYVSHFFGWHDP